jgi:hypothetical protein
MPSRMTNVARTNLSGGVFTTKIDTRTDTERYVSGLRRSDNMIPTIFGGCTKRPGTELIVISNEDKTYS